MPRSKGHVSEAELRQAIRSIRKVFGAAAVVFDTDGTVRVEPFEAEKYAKEKEDRKRAAQIKSGDQLEFPGSLASDADRDAFFAEHKRRYEVWKAALPSMPMGVREKKALIFLRSFGVGVPVHWRKVKDCGPDTEERLHIRGYIELGLSKKFPDRVETYALTAAGLAAIDGIVPEPRQAGSEA